MEPSMSKRIWHVLRAVYYMLRERVGRKRFVMELTLLLHRCKIAGKSISNFGSFHGRHGADDDDCSHKRHIEFSCSNTPKNYAYYPHLLPAVSKRGRHHRRGGDRGHDLDDFDATMIAKAFEFLNADEAEFLADDGSSLQAMVVTPSPMLVTARGTPSPLLIAAAARQLRITDSPFSSKDGDGSGEGNMHVDKDAEDFIQWFRGQLRMQSTAMTPCQYITGRLPPGRDRS